MPVSNGEMIHSLLSQISCLLEPEWKEVNTKPCTQLEEKHQGPKLLHLQLILRGMLYKVPWLLLPWSWGCTSFPISEVPELSELTQAVLDSCTP